MLSAAKHPSSPEFNAYGKAAACEPAPFHRNF